MTSLLNIEALNKHFDGVTALDDFSCTVCPNEILGLIGPNGADKTTLFNVLTGFITPDSGRMSLKGTELTHLAPHKRTRLGMARTFQNLQIGGYSLPKKELPERIEFVLEMFPVLRKRPKQAAGKLSGGEQQMLALARALIPKPKLQMLDEPSLGLAPALVAAVFEKVRQISADTGVSLLIVEQKVRDLLPICDRVYSLKLGKTVYSGPASELQDDSSRLKELFL